MQIFDNIGCSFDVNNNKDIVILGPLPGYNTLSHNHIGSTIPYLARNIISPSNVQWEIGVGLVEQNGSGIVIKNRKVVSSSSNNNDVTFSNQGNKQFYLFINSANFNTAFNNVSIKNSDFVVDNKKTVYVVDASSGYIKAQLPDASENEALEIGFKVIGNGTLCVSQDKENFELLLTDNSYANIVSTGSQWITLSDSAPSTMRSQSSDENVFSSMSQPGGSDRAIQYNNAGSFDASPLYVGNNNKILFGSSTESNAKHVVPSSGDYDVILNQTKSSSNLVVHGSGNLPNYPARNLIFTYDGKLGLNMPSGIKPATVFHIINNICHEDIRVENKSMCDNPAHIALYKNPYAINNADNKVIGSVSFSAKNGNGLKTTYSKIDAKTKSLSSSKGGLDFVVSNGTGVVTTVSTDPDSTKINHGNSSLGVSALSGNLSIGNSSIRLSPSNISISTSGAGSSIGISTGSSGAPINITGLVNANNFVRLTYIDQADVLLTLDNNRRIIAATGFKVPGIGAQSGNRILTTTSNGTVTGGLDINDLWPYETGVKRLGGKDLIWDRYPTKSAEVCIGKNTKELDLLQPASIDEFSVGDQLAIGSSFGSTTYANVSEVVVNNDQITQLILDNSVNLSGTLSIFSVSKGGVLTNRVYTSGILSDATANIISSRPGVPTVFNDLSKNIDFNIYGTETIPSFSMIASASVLPREAGFYHKFSTQFKFDNGEPIEPLPTRIQNNGFGTGGANNTVNYQEAADNGAGSWSGMVSAVGTNGRKSYYGTYDQNGNVYEWIEDDQKSTSNNPTQYICGGSWRSTDPNSLRGYVPTPRLSGFDDLGFRICSMAGFSDGTIDAYLNLNFARVDNTDNIADTNPIFTESFDNRFALRAEPMPVSKNNLGSVSYPYLISITEITNDQYCKFLNAVATGTIINGLYDTRMGSTAYGGIERTGDGNSSPYSYTAKSSMLGMPAVYINYFGAIRFINWLHNGAPSGANIPEGVTEDGAYYISEFSNSAYVSKNKNQKYWLPSLNEWHKAAYFQPLAGTVSTSGSAITIKREKPFEYASGLLSSLSVSGHTYTDTLRVGFSGAGGTLLNTVKDQDNNFKISIGHENVIKIEGENVPFSGAYGSYISNTGIVFATTGNTFFVNKINPTSFAKFTPTGPHFYGDVFIGSTGTGIADCSPTGTGTCGPGVKLTSVGLEYVDEDGNVIPGGMFPGPTGGFLFKETNTKVISSSKLKSKYFTSTSIDPETNEETETTALYPTLEDTPANSIIHNSSEGFLSGSDWFAIDLMPEGMEYAGDYIVGIHKPQPSGSGTGEGGGEGSGGTPELPPLLYTDTILVGPALDGFKGSILTHGGSGPATWEPADYLNAPGVTWTRYDRRAIEFIGDGKDPTDRIRFIDLAKSKGGTGPVSLDDIKKEFAYNETIAIYNQDRTVMYVKVSNVELVDSRSSLEQSTQLVFDENGLILSVCPPIPTNFYAESKLKLAATDTDNGRRVGYAFSVQKGAYLEMKIEPSAVSGFTCSGLSESSPYRFKPGTINTISIRPNIYTTFNKIAEDIDFIVYGHRKTLFTRYEPDWFSTDDNGVPSGLIPALRVHASIDNSVLGSLETGIFRATDIVQNQQVVSATGISLDLKSKITINMKDPYVVTSLAGVTKGIISPKFDPVTKEFDASGTLLLEKEYGMMIPPTGATITGSLPLSYYADLSVDGYTYTSGLISKEVVLSPLWTNGIPTYKDSIGKKLYVPNYPLTINSLGQIVSLIPAPNPELPSEPRNLTAQPKYNSVILKWDAPENDGGKEIFAYVVEKYLDAVNEWVSVDQLSSDGLPVTPDAATYRYVGNLIASQSYSFRVYAINVVGKSKVSLSVDNVMPMNDVPSKVIDLTVVRNEFNATLQWNPPSSAGAGAVLGYSVQYWQDDGVTPIADVSWVTYNSSVDPNTTSLTLSNILEKPTYYFKIIAFNAIGESEPSEIRSIGLDPDPRIKQPDTPGTVNDSWDFSGGSSGLGMMFTGVCY